ncbi:hypothetical protein UY3_05411 [Chelonia mydas]|uniref:Uncharacterized protein n=1 Tax=Chelonia mydas TaxID=8469 RepID=M7BNZ9_CHEMY|nr:hypothetical protein UY3_05411 [Chelonia mydas]
MTTKLRCGSALKSAVRAGKAPGQANGGYGKGGQHVPSPAPLPAAPIGLEQRTAASGSRDRPNLRTRQVKEKSLTTQLRNKETPQRLLHNVAFQPGLQLCSQDRVCSLWAAFLDLAQIPLDLAQLCSPA